jgi:competence protein ComEC
MWIMPLGMLSFLLMPLGLESLSLVPMGWGISSALWIADSVATLPGAVALVPSMPTTRLVILSLGGIWACVMRGRIRFYGLPAVAAGLASIVMVSAPDVIINRDGGLVAINLGAGRLVISPGAGNSFERYMCQRRFAEEEVALWPSSGIVAAAPIGCDPTGCILAIGGETVALVTEPAAATEDCAHADHVILLTRVARQICGDGKVVVSTFYIWRDGAQAIWFTLQGPVVETSRERRGDRPWSRISEKRRQYLD